MKRFSLFSAGVLLALSANTVFAATQACAIINGGDAGGGGGVNTAYTGDQTGQANEGCNVLITFNSNGSITTTLPNAAVSYDAGLDDNMVGIVNNSGHAITSITLSSTGDIFGFDGDGMCDTDGQAGWTFAAAGPSRTSQCGTAVASTNGFFYLPAGVTDSGVNAAQTSGTINFLNGGISATLGSTADFSLEGPVDVNLGVNVPEPSAIVLLGSILLAAAWSLRRRSQSARS
jgi:hypothetical protein